jgi:hypothetical protein
MQKYVCFRERFARGAKRKNKKQEQKSKSKMRGFFPFDKLRVRMTSKEGAMTTGAEWAARLQPLTSASRADTGRQHRASLLDVSTGRQL